MEESREGGAEEEGSLQYDQASNLYYDTSASPTKYFHWNPKEQEHMLVIIPDNFLDEWGYWKVSTQSPSPISPFYFSINVVKEESAVDVDVDALMQHSKKKKKLSSKRKKLKEEKFLAKKARDEKYSH
jgi:hypothetical protein